MTKMTSILDLGFAGQWWVEGNRPEIPETLSKRFLAGSVAEQLTDWDNGQKSLTGLIWVSVGRPVPTLPPNPNQFSKIVHGFQNG